MYHSITIGSKNTWDDWHLIPKTRPLVNPPEVKTNYVDIPGGDGSIDLSTALSGRPIYKNRNGSWDFYVENDFKPWQELYTEIMTYLHGQEFRVILEDDPHFYYQGRLSVNTWRSDQYWSLITIDYEFSPFKRETISSVDAWIWDTFNFETDIVPNYKDIPVNGTKTVTVIGTGSLAVCPVIVTTAAGMTVQFKGITYSLERGLNVIDQIEIATGENLLTFSGTGEVSIEFSGGSL